METDEHNSVFIETISLSVDIPEAVGEIPSVHEIFPAAADLFPSGHIGGSRSPGGGSAGTACRSLSDEGTACAECISLSVNTLRAGHHDAVCAQIVGLAAVREPSGLHISILLVEEIPLAVDLLPACPGVIINRREIVLSAVVIQPSLEEIACLGAEVIPSAVFGNPFPARVHMTVCEIEQVFFAVDPFPADKHFSAFIEIVGLSVYFLETNEHDPVFVEAVGLSVDIPEAVGEIFSIQEIFPAAVYLFPSGHIGD